MKGKKIKDLAAKKGFRIGAVAVLVALFAIVGIVRISGKEAAASSTAILSAKAAKGSISTTVSGSGNLQAADTVDVSVPTGIEIDEVKVSQGDTVSAGDTLATVKKASVASALIEVDENLSEVSKKLNSGSLSSLEKEELDEVYAKLTARKSTLTALHDTLTITATVDGIVGSVNVSANSSVSQSSSGSTSNSTSNSTNSSDSNSATGTSSGMSKLSSSLLNLTASSTGTEEASVVTDFSKLLIPAPKTGEKGISSIDEEKTREQGYKVSSITWVRP